MAWDLDSLTDKAVGSVDDTVEATEKIGTKEAPATEDKSITDKAKGAATEGAKGGAEGAVDGAKSGSITDGASKGAVDGAKSGFSSQ